MFILITINLLALISSFVDLDPGIEAIKAYLEKSEYSTTYVEVRGLRYPVDIISLKNSLFIQTETKLIEWDRESERILSHQDITDQTVIGSQGERMYICSWENFLIEDPSQYSTVIHWREYEKEEKRFEIYKTVKPIECGADTITVKNAYDILETNYYTLDVSSGGLSETDLSEEFISQESIKDIHISDDGRIWIVGQTKRSLKERVLQTIVDITVSLTGRVLNTHLPIQEIQPD